MMPTTLRSALALAILAALVGCGGLLGALAPDIEVANAFGIDGAVVALDPEGATTIATTTTAATRAASTTFSGTISLPLAFELDANVPIAAASVSETIGISATVAVHGDVAALPASFTVTGSALSLVIAPAGGGAPLFDASFVGSTGATFVQDEATCTGDGCSYEAEGETVALVDAVVNGVQAATLFGIVTSEGTYLVTGTLVLELSSPLDAATITVTIETSDGLITF